MTEKQEKIYEVIDRCLLPIANDYADSTYKYIRAYSIKHVVERLINEYVCEDELIEVMKLFPFKTKIERINTLYVLHDKMYDALYKGSYHKSVDNFQLLTRTQILFLKALRLHYYGEDFGSTWFRYINNLK